MLLLPLLIAALVPFAALSVIAFPRNYLMAPLALPYEEAEAWCQEHHGPTAVLAGYTGYPAEELALMRLCASDEQAGAGEEEHPSTYAGRTASA